MSSSPKVLKYKNHKSLVNRLFVLLYAYKFDLPQLH
jgi:hypothetical protein